LSAAFLIIAELRHSYRALRYGEKNILPLSNSFAFLKSLRFSFLQSQFSFSAF